MRINEYEFFQVKQNADLRNCKVNLEGQQHFKRLLQSIRNEKTWTFAEKKERETSFKVNYFEFKKLQNCSKNLISFIRILINFKHMLI